MSNREPANQPSHSLESLSGPASLCSSYSALSCPFTVRSPSRSIAAAIDFVYGEMRAPEQEGGLEITIRADEKTEGRLQAFFNDELVVEADRIGDLLHNVDNELTVALEHSVPSLYFVHAAVLAEEGRATLIVGASGAGKSTTAYALAVAGMEYLSDELAPIEPTTGSVEPYPRAICLKRDPPAPLRLPGENLRTEWTLHVRPRDLTTRIAVEPVPVARVLFVKYSPAHARASLRPMTRGEGAIRLYREALNQLAHPSEGIDETLNVIRRAECFELLAAGVEDTVRAVRG